MGKLSEFGSATVIILLNLTLASIAYSQSEPDPIADPILNVSDANIDSTINQYPALVLDCYKSGVAPVKRWTWLWMKLRRTSEAR